MSGRSQTKFPFMMCRLVTVGAEEPIRFRLIGADRI